MEIINIYIENYYSSLDPPRRIGMDFRTDVLIPAPEKAMKSSDTKVVIHFGDYMTLSSSFLMEAFSGISDQMGVDISDKLSISMKKI